MSNKMPVDEPQEMDSFRVESGNKKAELKREISGWSCNTFYWREGWRTKLELPPASFHFALALAMKYIDITELTEKEKRVVPYLANHIKEIGQ